MSRIEFPDVDRFEVIVSGPDGRAYVNMNCRVSVHLQDDGKTMKVFVDMENE